MVRINLDTPVLTEKDKKLKKHFHSLEPSLVCNPDSSFDVTCNGGKTKFKIKKSGWDDKGSIDGFFAEEDMRVRFFYPNLPRNFFDVGTAHGSWALPALAMGCKVVAFEIDPRYIKSFLGSVSINLGFNCRLDMIECGLFSNGAKGNFFEVEDVEFVYMDYFVANTHQIPQFIKIDVEGMEFEVLKGAKKTLDLFHPIIFLELHHVEGKMDLKSKEARRLELFDILKPFDYKVTGGRTEKAFDYLFFF